MNRIAFVALVATSSSAWASVPIDGTASDAKYDNVFRIGINVNDSGVKYAKTGTATLIGKKQESDKVLHLTFLSAYHVFDSPGSASFGGVAFRGQGQQGSFDVTHFAHELEVTGPRYKDSNKYVDMLWVGVTVKLKEGSNPGLTQAEFDALKALTPMTMGVAPALPSEGLEFTSVGYGISSPGADADHPGYDYVWKKEGPAYANSQYGTRRKWSNKFVQEELVDNDSYKFDSLKYNITNDRKQFGLPGDSGSGIVHDNKIIGVLAQGTYDVLSKDASGRETGIGVKVGTHYGRASKFDQELIDYMNEKNKQYLVPEPASILWLAGGWWMLAKRRAKSPLRG